MIKTVSYPHTNSYEVLFPIKPTTQNIWLCFHGIGYLSTYFKRYFKKLDPELNAVFIPQAPSKYYLGTDFKHVGASWPHNYSREVGGAVKWRHGDRL